MTTNHMCENLLVGVCGSIHAIHIHTYLLRFREGLASHIKVIMTRSAQTMVSTDTVRLYVDDCVFTDLWQHSAAADRAPHIQLTRWADLFVIVPATANLMGKAAHGIADDLLSTAIVSSPQPVVFAPAMNPAMWASKAVQRNVRQLTDDGHVVVPPQSGTSVTSGEWDRALAPTPDLLLRHLQQERMQRLRASYWEEATRERPLTQALKKLRARAAAPPTSTAAPPT